MDQAIVLAAGFGHRLVEGKPFPKPLAPVGGRPLIDWVLRSLAGAGVKRANVVVGYMGDLLSAHLESASLPLEVRCIMHSEFSKPNGTSVLAAADVVTGPTFLTMADHLFAPTLPQRVRDGAPESAGAVLGVDTDIAACFDLDDATLVKREGSRVIDIGKTITEFDSIDTGVFLIGPPLIEALRRAETHEGCSLSQGVKALCEEGTMHTVDVTGELWADVDTPEARAHALEVFDFSGSTVKARGAGVSSAPHTTA